MDFWSLIGGRPASPTKPTKTHTDAERLAACQRICRALQHTWRTSTPRSPDDGATKYVVNLLERLNTILDEESRKPATYPCLLYVASVQIYIIVAKLAIASQDPSFVTAAARFFHILINGEAEGVLDSKIFARSLIDLVRSITSSSGVVLDEKEEADLVELLFGVATKIRSAPDILPVWFDPEREKLQKDPAPEAGTNFAGATRRSDFQLFYLLLEYIYHDGGTGDFARTGLLYLIETTSKSNTLEKWVIESDLATIMASGLGALYSRLSRRPPSLTDVEKLPPILALSDLSQLPANCEPHTPDLKPELDSFISFLMFWQDALDHCYSAEVTETLLDHFQVLFLQQLLYPSLLESSDIDEGPTASAITYLYQTLNALDHPALVQRILQYLLASAPQPKVTKPSGRHPRMSMSRRKSLDRLTAMAGAADNTPPVMFNLVDLTVSSLKSKHSQTVVASLKLVSVIVRKHHRYADFSLFKTSTIQLPTYRGVAQLNAAMLKLFDFATEIAGAGAIEQSYETLLQDTRDLLENHSCATQTKGEKFAKHEENCQSLAPTDGILNEIVLLLSSFFGNDVITNLALTESITCLASCRLISLDGWLLTRSDAEGDNQDTGSILALMDSFVGQIRQWQAHIPEWPKLIASHKELLLNDTAAANRAGPPPTDPAHETADSSRPSSQASALRQQISERSSSAIDTHSHPADPRGQKKLSTLQAKPSGSVEASLLSTTHAAAPQARRCGSPPQESMPLPSSVEASSSMNAYISSSKSDLLPRRILLPLQPLLHSTGDGSEAAADSNIDSASNGTSSGAVTPSERQVAAEEVSKSVSLSHILTSAIILQEFILEIAAVIQIRASLFGEADFNID